MASTPLTESEISERLAALSGWEREGGMISRTFRFDTYLAGVAFAAAVGTVCEGRNHHPDLLIGYKKVTVSFTTHDAGSQLTAKDFDAAAAIAALGYPKG
ncbi:4a-hydroxytetrahydrobiopterin dehydratase [Kamptonema cortianum]|nr:4a-hydroxytetrahydrobiopterin dehydratase [Kamptonema cortianum]